jgi:hypothetical protein
MTVPSAVEGVEDALRAQYEADKARGHAYRKKLQERLDRAFSAIKDAYDAMEPLIEIDGEGVEDYADDRPTVVVCGRSTHYAIKLGDFRKLRSAYGRLEAILDSKDQR